MGKVFKFKDSKILQTAVNKSTIKALYRFGSFVKRDAASSIRKKKKPSRPGQAPRSVTGALKRGIRFEVDERRKTVRIGVFKDKDGLTANVLEYGGNSFTTKEQLLLFVQGK